MPYLICGLHLGMHCILLRGAFCNDPQPLEGVYFSAILLFLCKWSSLWFISKWFKSAAKGEVGGMGHYHHHHRHHDEQRPGEESQETLYSSKGAELCPR